MEGGDVEGEEGPFYCSTGGGEWDRRSRGWKGGGRTGGVCGGSSGLGLGTGTGTGSARSLSLAPSQRMSASARVCVCVKELADANGNANENANGNANGNGTSTMIGVGGWACACGRGRRGHGRGTWDLGPATCDLRPGTWGTWEHGRGRGPRLDPARLDFFGFLPTVQALSRSLISLPLSPRSPGPRSSSRAGAPGQGTAATHKVQSRYLTIPLAARQLAKYRPRSHLANDGTTPSQRAACWGPARLSRLVLPRRCWCNCCTQVLYRATVVSWSSGP